MTLHPQLSTRSMSPRPLLFLLLASCLGTLAAGCLDRPGAQGSDDEPYLPADDDDDATEDPWDDPIWSDDDDSAVDGQLGTVSFSYNFVVNSADYWDCQRRYRWVEMLEAAASGCTDCLSTWRVRYELVENNCGDYGWSGHGYQLTSGLDPIGNWLWFTHDEGLNWLRFPGQGSIIEGNFEADWTWIKDCFDLDGDGECDPGSEMSYRELFRLHW